MSLRPTNTKNPMTTSVSGVPRSIPNASRLEHVLAAGYARQVAPVDMMGADQAVRGGHLARKCLFIKGFVWGIPQDKMQEATDKAKEIIFTEGITTICWDGDKLGYPGPNQEPPPMTFTFVIKALAAEVPGLEFIYFKKAGKAKGLVTGDGFGSVDLDEGAAKHGTTQYIGPMDFLTPANTIIVDAGDIIPAKRAGMNLGIELSGGLKWDELGLAGLALAKSHFQNDEVSYLVVGMGPTVEREIEDVQASFDNGESKYPRGVIMGENTVVEVVRG